MLVTSLEVMTNIFPSKEMRSSRYRKYNPTRLPKCKHTYYPVQHIFLLSNTPPTPHSSKFSIHLYGDISKMKKKLEATSILLTLQKQNLISLEEDLIVCSINYIFEALDNYYMIYYN